MRFALTLFVLCCVSLLGAEIRLSISDLDEFQSPQYKMMLQKQDARSAALRNELKWQNPEFEAELEKLQSRNESETEKSAVFSKHIMMPWSYAAHRNIVNNELNVLEMQLQQGEIALRAELRSLYAELSIKTQLFDQLKQLHTALNHASRRVKEQHDQGTISGLEAKLVAVSLFNTHANMLHLEQEKQMLQNELLTGIGLPTNTELELVTPILYQSIDLLPVSQIVLQAGRTVRVQKQNEQVNAAQKRVAFEKGNILPHLGIKAGYKSVNDELNGAVLGLSVPLPLFNINRFKVQQSQADLVYAELQRDLEIRFIDNEIRERYGVFKKSQNLFQLYADLFKTDESMIDDLVYSYEQGWLSVTDLLNSLQVYADGIESYYEHLTHYYHTIFQLEKLTEQTFFED